MLLKDGHMKDVTVCQIQPKTFTGLLKVYEKKHKTADYYYYYFRLKIIYNTV